MRTTWTKEQRDRLLVDWETAEDARVAAAKRREPAIRDAYYKERDRIEKAYWDGLPCEALSRCPHCDEPLVKAFDRWGLDGLFWQEEQQVYDPVEPTPCPHFAVLLGAVHLNGLPPRGGRVQARTGPEVPFVVPRLLAFPKMVAVLTSIRMENGYTAYPIAYFADPVPEGIDLTQPWTKTTYSFESVRSPGGGRSWSMREEVWDFDLAPWIAKGTLRWIAPGDPDLRYADPSAPCPYLDLPGRRIGLTVEGDDAWPKVK